MYIDLLFYYSIRQQSYIMTLLYLLCPIIIAILYIFYMFIIKIHIEAARFKKMDPKLKVFVAPFSGLQGVQK